MRSIVLTCTAHNYGSHDDDEDPPRERFVITFNEFGEPEIRNESDPIAERDRSSSFPTGDTSISLEVEAA